MLDKIYKYLEEKAPIDTCESWDNSGLLIRGNRQVTKALLTMDITSEVVKEAAQGGYELIISHHPVIFKGIKKLEHEDVVFQLIQNNISAICMHTNLDAARGGVNDVLAASIGLKEILPFANGLGRMGILEEASSVEELAQHIANVLETTVKYSLPDKAAKCVAVIGGSAGEFWAEAKEAGADVFVTGEASHHHTLDAMEEDTAIIVAGHWNSEHPVLAVIREELKASFEEVQFDISIGDKDPFHYVMGR